MTTKEISVLIIGLMLVGFLYLMKNPNTENMTDLVIESNQSIGIDLIPDSQQSSFNPATNNPALENILDIPAWTFDLAALEALTSDELVTSIQEAINKGDYFLPKNKNALFYLINLKSLSSDNENIAQLALDIQNELDNQASLAIADNDEKLLVDVISRSKTLDATNPQIKNLQSKLATIKTVNKIYSIGKKQILDDNIISENSQDAWHSAKQLLEVDSKNVKTLELVNEVIYILANNALRAAEEIDFKMANNQIARAELLLPESPAVILTQNTINDLKQQRYQWLEQQISIAIQQANVERSTQMMTQLQQLGLDQQLLNEYQSEIKRITVFGKFKPFDIFIDKFKNTIDLPQMVVMPINSFMMGSTDGAKNQKPFHKVNINYGFAVSQNEISVKQFELFIENSDYKTDADVKNSSRIYDMRTGRLKNKNRVNWSKNFIGKKASPNDPVIHVSWNDALAYTAWISQQTGKNYRLITESEFEYVLRAGSSSYYPWGEGTPLQVIENLTGKLDNSRNKSRAKWKTGFDKYNDKHWGPAPVGSFITNSFKLNDTAGNVMEWVMDCWHDSYARAPIDGSSWSNPGCENHVIRGGSWSSAKKEFSSAHRFTAKANYTDARLGFRIAVNLK
jgi:formylglycine-generating enzyme required for sulfatase activity